jgi:hypothetical protein
MRLEDDKETHASLNRHLNPTKQETERINVIETDVYSY